MWRDLLAYVLAPEDARRGARGTVERALLPHVDGARVEPDRVARGHDIRLEVSERYLEYFISFDPVLPQQWQAGPVTWPMHVPRANQSVFLAWSSESQQANTTGNRQEEENSSAVRIGCGSAMDN